jgi:hypothetical protein
MIEKHYGKYIISDAKEQLKKLFEGEAETWTETPSTGDGLKGMQVAKKYGPKEMVGASGFEPPTSRSRTVRSTKLSHAPTR